MSDQASVVLPVEKLYEYSKSRDQRLRNEIVEIMMPFAERVARQFAHKGEPLDDLQQVATLGLLKAVERFDPENGADFLAFASVTIRGEIKRHFRDKTWKVRVPRRLQELNLLVRQTRTELTAQLARAPKVAELATAMGVSQEDVIEALEVESAYNTDSLDVPASNSPDALPRSATLGHEDERYEQADSVNLVTQLLDSLEPRDRQIVELRFFAGESQIEIAERIGISQMHVSRLLNRIMNIMRLELERAEVPQ